jgi:hypothetical protein
LVALTRCAVSVPSMERVDAERVAHEKVDEGERDTDDDRPPRPRRVVMRGLFVTVTVTEYVCVQVGDTDFAGDFDADVVAVSNDLVVLRLTDGVHDVVGVAVARVEVSVLDLADDVREIVRVLLTDKDDEDDANEEILCVMEVDGGPGLALIVSEGDCVGGLGESDLAVGDPDNVASPLKETVFVHVIRTDVDVDSVPREGDKERVRDLEMVLTLADVRPVGDTVRAVGDTDALGGECDPECVSELAVTVASGDGVRYVGLSVGLPDRVTSEDSVTESLRERANVGEAENEGVELIMSEYDREVLPPLRVTERVLDGVTDLESVNEPVPIVRSDVGLPDDVRDKVWLCVLVAPNTRPMILNETSLLVKKNM